MTMTDEEEDEDDITWSVRLAAGPERVYGFLATAAGRERFWAESAPEVDGRIEFEFPNGETMMAPILTAAPPDRFALRYFGTRATFTLRPATDGGTILTVTHADVEAAERCETMAGWVSVLLALKAAVDHDVDLRNHDPSCTWAQGFVGN